MKLLDLLRKQIEEAVFPRFYAGEEGAPSSAKPIGAESINSIDDEVSAADFDNDREYMDLVSQNDPDFKTQGSEDQEAQESNENDSEETDDNEDENSGDDETDSIPDDDTEEDSGDEDESDGSPDDEEGDGSEELDFADDVIPGVKGEHLKNIPTEAQEAIGEYVSKYQEASEELEKTKSRLDALLSDPYVKYRAEMIDSGKADSEIDQAVYEEEIAKRLKEELGLSDDEVKSLEKITKHAASRQAEVVIHNQSQRQMVESRVKEVHQKASEIIHGMGEFWPEMKVNETDYTKFYKANKDGKVEFNQDHPEFNTWHKGQRAFIEWLRDKGITKEEMVSRGRASIAAQFAEDNKKPFVLNAEERDAKIRKSLRKSSLSPLLKNSGKKGLSTGSSNANDGNKGMVSKKAQTKGGFDLVRLYEDDKYFEAAMDKNPMDAAHIEKIQELREEGAKIVDRRNKKK